MPGTSGLACRSCERTILGAALACVACGALHHEGCLRTAGHCAACTCAKPAVPVSVGGRERNRAAALLSAGMALLALAGALALTNRPATPVVCVHLTPSAPVDAMPAGSVTGHWRGTISGNDPSVTADVSLAQDGPRVTGLLVWTSPNSGRSHRRVAGFLDPDRHLLMLRDVEMPVAQASGSWRFCPVDYYLLDFQGDELTGSYWSTPCNDRARVRLHRAP